jgi:hypothetical protein
MLNHNPSLLQLRRLGVPNFAALGQGAYIHKLSKELVIPNSVTLFQELNTILVNEEGGVYDINGVDPECKLDSTSLEKQLDMIDAPNAVSPKKCNREADDLGGDTWTSKEQAINDSKVVLDIEVDVMDPDYMYPRSWNAI